MCLEWTVLALDALEEVLEIGRRRKHRFQSAEDLSHTLDEESGHK